MAGYIYIHSNIEETAELAHQAGTDQVKQKTIFMVSNKEQARYLGRNNPHPAVEWMTMDQWVVRLMSGHEIISAVEQCGIVQQELRQMVETNQTTYFNQENCFRISWIQLVVDLIEEIKRSNILPQRLKQLWKMRGAKKKEFALLYEAYQRRLKEENLMDHPEMYIQLIKKLPHLSSILPKRVILEGFQHLYPIQEQLLIQLVTLGVTVELHVVADPLRPRLFQEMFGMVERLEQRGFVRRFDSVSAQSSPQRKNSVLAHLAKYAFSEEAPTVSIDPLPIHVISAEGIQAEVEQLVIHLKQYLQESQVPYRDVAIISSHLSEYEEFLHTYLARAGIPVAEDWQQPLTDHALWQTILALFQVRHGQLSWFGVLTESAFLPFRRWISQLGQAPDSIEEWITLIETELNQGQEPFQLFEWIQQIPEQLSWEDWLAWFAEWIQPLNPMKQQSVRPSNSAEIHQLAESLRAWQSLQQLLERLQKIAHGTTGQSELTWRRFIDWIEQTARQIQIVKRPAQKGGIRFLKAELAQGYVFRAVFLLGCVEGKWPRAYRDHLLVSDVERARLRQEGVYLLYSTELAKRQLFSFFMSMITATDQLYFFYSHADEKGTKQLPSPYLKEALQVFRQSPVTRFYSAHELVNWSTCYSLEKGKRFALQLLAQGEQMTEEHQTAIQVIESWKRKSSVKWGSLMERIKVERLRQFTSAHHPFQGQITDPSLLKQIRDWMETRVWHPAELNHLVECPFRFMAQHLWKANTWEKSSEGMSSTLRDHLIRKVLVRTLERGEEQNLLLQQNRASQMLHQYLADAEVGDSLFHFELDRQKIEQSLFHYLEYEHQLRTRQGYQLRPAYLQLTFGQSVQLGRQDPHSIEQPVLLQISEGITIPLQGRIDRIDQDDDGNTILYLYKSKISTSSGEIIEGQDLYLPLYVKVLEQHFHIQMDQLIGAAYYTKQKKGAKNQRNIGLWRQEKKTKAKLHSRTKALEKEKWIETFQQISQLIEGKWQQVQQGNCSTQPTWDCSDYCPQKTICRAYRQSKEGDQFE